MKAGARESQQARELKWRESPLSRPVADRFDVLLCRRQVRWLAETLGVPAMDASNLALVVSELAQNLVVHALGRRRLLLGVVARESQFAIQVVSEDEGPGIPDTSKALQDGFSTSGGLGGGLPAVVRLMDEVEITSEAGRPTRIVARKWFPCR